jgi:HTH-type transcriptional regulator/antitoxin HigA
MDIRPLRTEDDYETALREIENLWGAPFGSPEGDRLEVLVTLVEAYEEKHYPADVLVQPYELRRA